MEQGSEGRGLLCPGDAGVDQRGQRAVARMVGSSGSKRRTSAVDSSPTSKRAVRACRGSRLYESSCATRRGR